MLCGAGAGQAGWQAQDFEPGAEADTNPNSGTNFDADRDAHAYANTPCGITAAR